MPGSLWLGNDVAGSIVTECDGSLHQEDDCCGIEADGEDDFEHGLLVFLGGKDKASLCQGAAQK